ncbi:hypothetical protein FRC07_001661, partial [Ceratobasidium sp. 392]
DEPSQTTDDTFLSSADLSRTEVSSLGPQSKVEKLVPPIKRAIARKFKHRSGFDRVNKRRLREQKAKRVIGPVIEEPKRRRAEPDASPTAEAPSVPRGEDQNTEATISAEEVAEVPRTPDTSSTTLKTTLATPETSFADLETAPATPDTTLATSYTAPSTPRTNPYKSSFPGLSFKLESKGEPTSRVTRWRRHPKTEVLLADPKMVEPPSKHTKMKTVVEGLEKELKEVEEAEEDKPKEGEELDGDGFEEGPQSEESEDAEESKEGEEQANVDAGYVDNNSAVESDCDTGSVAGENKQVSTLEREDSVSVPNEQPSTLSTGDPTPALVGIQAFTDAVPAIPEAPTVMEAAQMAEEGQVVEPEERPIASEESTNVTDAREQATPAPTVDTPGPTGDLSGSITPGALEPRKRPSDEFEGECKKSEGLEEGEEGEEGKESESVKESEEIEGEEENNRDVGSGVAESNQVSTSAVEDSAPVPNEEPNTLPAGDSVPVPADMSASTDATAAVTGAPAVMETAQTVEQGQVVKLEEAPVANEKSKNVTDGEQATPAPTMDTSGPTSNAPLSTNTGQSSAYTLGYLMETPRQLVKTPGLAGFSNSSLASQSPSSKLDRSSPTSSGLTQANTSVYVSSATTNDVSIVLASSEDALRGPERTNKLITKTRVKSNNSPMRMPKVVEEARVAHDENKWVALLHRFQREKKKYRTVLKETKKVDAPAAEDLPQRKTKAARSHRTDAPSLSIVSLPTPMVLATPSTLLPYSRPSGSSSSTPAPRSSPSDLKASQPNGLASSASYAPGVMTPKTWQPR